MKVIENSHIACFDVDDTLVMWGWLFKQDPARVITIPLNGFNNKVEPNELHIELLRRYKAKGKFIIVWSKSGYKWAEAVVKALDLEQFVDLVMTKPEKYVDDLKADEWMEHIYKETDGDNSRHN